jgi:hypothetical protein
VGLFRRKKPLHVRLAEAGGIEVAAPAPSPLGASPPGWFGETRGEAGIHGVPRVRRWDAVVTVEAPSLRGDAVHFAALPDRSLVVDEDEPHEAMRVLADAVSDALDPPYRAEAVRRHEDLWTVGASRILVVEEPSLEGEEVELTRFDGAETLVVDGTPSLRRIHALARAGEAEGRDYVVRARRLAGPLWEVEATPL